MTIHIDLSLKFVLLALALLAFIMCFWSLGLKRYSGIGGGIAWLVYWLWLLPAGAILLVWSIVEFVR